MTHPHLDEDWKNARNNELSDRRAEAAGPKSAQLNAYRVAKTVVEPNRVARQAERTTVAAARDARRLERTRLKLDEQNHLEKEATGYCANRQSYTGEPKGSNRRLLKMRGPERPNAIAGMPTQGKTSVS